jgi:hypothetical protein
LTQSLLQEASPWVRETPGTTRKSSKGRTAHLLCCSSLTRGFNAVNRSPQVAEASLQPQTDAGLLCEGPWLALLSCWLFGTHCPSLQRTLRASRERARSHEGANGSELESRKSWSCQARRQGLCHGLKLPDNMQCRLGIARQPASGRDMELRDSNSCQGRVTCKVPARVLLPLLVALSS